MISAIQNISSGVGAASAYQSSRTSSNSGEMAKADGVAQDRETENTSPMFNRPRQEIVRLGFGDGTISTPTAAIRTLGRGIESARNIVPKPADLEKGLGANGKKAEGKKKFQEQASVRVSNPAAGARDFINGLDQSVKAAQARLAGQEPPSNVKNASLEVNGQAIDYIRVQSDTTIPPAASRLNVLA